MPSMKYENMSHEERELTLFIENNEKQLNNVKAEPYWKTIKKAARDYKQNYAKLPDKLFTLNNFYNVASYFRNKFNH